MPDNYTKFLEKIGEVEVAIEELERAGVKLPLPVAKELCCGVFFYVRADEKLFDRYKKRDEKRDRKRISDELRDAANCASLASFHALKFRFLFYSKFVRSVIDVLKKNKRHISNYSEQSENFSKITKLIDDAKSPEEDSPKSQTDCENVIKKLLAFLSDFKTDKGKLFPMKYAEPKIGVHGMANSYKELKCELFENFDEVETKIEELGSASLEFPLSVAKDLCYGIISYIKADEKLSQGDEEEAVREMKEAVYHSQWARFGMVKLSFLGSLREARDTCTKKIKGNKDPARLRIYEEHSKNLHEITSWIENKKWPNEDPLKSQYFYEENGKKLKAFSLHPGMVSIYKIKPGKQEPPMVAQESRMTRLKKLGCKWWGCIIGALGLALIGALRDLIGEAIKFLYKHIFGD